MAFLNKHHFDFNTLFEKGVSFSRLTEKDKLNSLCTEKIARMFQFVPWSGSLRAFSTLSKAHVEKSEELMVAIENFVYDPTSEEAIVFEVESYALKKELKK